MEIKPLSMVHTDRVRIVSESGIYDPKSGRIHSDVVCSENASRRFIDALEVRLIDEHQNEVIKPSFDAEHPIEYVEGMPLVNNAFYEKDGEVYVWMNQWVKW